ncbi:MAG: transposase [Planctomycetaceae bacterium]
MVIASHVIFSAYGFWLPNDPRGSWSDFVGAWELFRFGGAATKVDTRRSLAGDPHDRKTRIETKWRLKYPAVTFTGIQARAIGNGFRQFSEKNGLRIWACAILPDHAHLVIARHKTKVEQLVTLLKGAATRALVDEGVHPFAGFPKKNGCLPKCWARGEWKVFLDDAEDVARAISYVEDNPVKEGLPAQRWSFVTEFDSTPV